VTLVVKTKTPSNRTLLLNATGTSVTGGSIKLHKKFCDYLKTTALKQLP
jgi:hypothetical protein